MQAISAVIGYAFISFCIVKPHGYFLSIQKVVFCMNNLLNI
jgi:hypothetical protein